MFESSAIDSAAVGVVVADDARRYVEANDAACSVLGLPRSAIVGARVEDVMAAPRATVEALWERFRAEGVMVGSFVAPRSGGAREIQYVAVADVGDGRHLSVWLPPPEPRGWQRLSHREREVVRLVARGATSREVGEALSVTAATVETHIRNAMRRLGARNRSHLVTLAILRHEIDLDALDA